MKSSTFIGSRLLHMGMTMLMASLLGIGMIQLFAALGPLPIMLCLFMAFWCMSQSSQLSHSMGSARFASYTDLILSGLTFNESGVLIGKTLRLNPPSLKRRCIALFNMPLSMSRHALAIFSLSYLRNEALRLPRELAVHAAFFAPTGQGKSTAYVISNLLTDPHSAIVLDFKGELFRDTAWVREHMFGHSVVCFAPFGLPNGIKSQPVGFNPLRLIDPESPFYLDYAASMAKSLVVREPSEHQPFFNNASEMVLTSLLALLIAEGPSHGTLGDLRMITSLPEEMDQAVDYMLNKAKRYPEQMRQLAGPILSLKGEAGLSVISTINSHLRWLDSIPVARSLSATEFDPSKLVDPHQRMTLYIHIPVDLIHTYRGLIRVIFSSLIHYIFQAGESSGRRIRFYLDEAHGLGPGLDALYAALVYGRSFGINLNFYFQALSQIEEVFEGSRAKDFMANIVPIFAGIRDLPTATEVSNWMGRYTVEAASRQAGFNLGTSHSYSDRGGQTVGRSYGINESRSHQEQSRPLLMPEEILQLPPKTSIITMPHTPPIIARPPFYFEDRTLSRLVEQSRRHACDSGD